MDEGRRGVAVDNVVGEEAPAGWQTEEGGVSRLERRGYGGLGFRMAKMRRWEMVNHDLGTCLSKM